MFNLLDTVVLDRDLPERGLRRGDLGAVVDLADVRAVGDADLIAVRDLERTA